MSLALRTLELKAAKRARETSFAVSPNPGATVSGRRARGDGVITTAQGAKLKHRRGDMILTYGPGDHAVFRGAIFKDTYKRVGRGKYQKRSDITLSAAVAKRGRTIRTLEGPVKAKRGDVIMTGLHGERWPIPRDKFTSKYRVHF